MVYRYTYQMYIVNKNPTVIRTSKLYRYTVHHGNPQPSFLGVITHNLGCKTFIFHGFGVQGMNDSGLFPSFSLGQSIFPPFWEPLDAGPDGIERQSFF